MNPHSDYEDEHRPNIVIFFTGPLIQQYAELYLWKQYRIEEVHLLIIVRSIFIETTSSFTIIVGQ